MNYFLSHASGGGRAGGGGGRGGSSSSHKYVSREWKDDHWTYEYDVKSTVKEAKQAYESSRQAKAKREAERRETARQLGAKVKDSSKKIIKDTKKAYESVKRGAKYVDNFLGRDEKDAYMKALENYANHPDEYTKKNLELKEKKYQHTAYGAKDGVKAFQKKQQEKEAKANAKAQERIDRGRRWIELLTGKKAVKSTGSNVEAPKWRDQ